METLVEVDCFITLGSKWQQMGMWKGCGTQIEWDRGLLSVGCWIVCWAIVASVLCQELPVQGIKCANGLIYGSETWVIRCAERRKMNVLEMKCLRSDVYAWSYEWRHTEIELVSWVYQRVWRWFGQPERINKPYVAGKVLLARVMEGRQGVHWGYIVYRWCEVGLRWWSSGFHNSAGRSGKLWWCKCKWMHSILQALHNFNLTNIHSQLSSFHSLSNSPV